MSNLKYEIKKILIIFTSIVFVHTLKKSLQKGYFSLEPIKELLTSQDTLKFIIFFIFFYTLLTFIIELVTDYCNSKYK
jgi:polyferredoxin